MHPDIKPDFISHGFSEESWPAETKPWRTQSNICFPLRARALLCISAQGGMSNGDEIFPAALDSINMSHYDRTLHAIYQQKIQLSKHTRLLHATLSSPSPGLVIMLHRLWWSQSKVVTGWHEGSCCDLETGELQIACMEFPQ